MIAVIRYGLGNVGSVKNMLSHLGAHVEIIDSPDALSDASHIILPGVGSFGRGAELLRSSGFHDAILRWVKDEKGPLLGICLGMQLLGKNSEEGEGDGLGLIDAACHRLQPTQSDLRVPHMGWNTVIFDEQSPFHDNITVQRFYFVHSYCMRLYEDVCFVGRTDYGGRFISFVQKGNVIGMQFHPEKSHRHGMKILSRFLEL